MPDHLGGDMRKVRPEEKEEEIKCKYIVILIYCFQFKSIYSGQRRFTHPNKRNSSLIGSQFFHL